MATSSRVRSTDLAPPPPGPLPCLTPLGRLVLTMAPDADPLPPEVAARLQEAFAQGPGHGLLRLGAGEAKSALPAVWAYWRELGRLYVTALCSLPDVQAAREGAPDSPLAQPVPPDTILDQLAAAPPVMPGSEYLSRAVLNDLWTELGQAVQDQVRTLGLSVQELLHRYDPAWNVVGRVHLNLAENRQDPDAPFALLATYTTRLSAGAKPQHLPLGQALREFAGDKQRDRLLSLLLPIQRAAATCPWLRTLIDTGELFHPLRWTPREALRLLRDVPQLEQAGVVVRMPASWKMGRPARPQVTATIGGRQPAGLGLEALLDFSVELTVDGEPLSGDEVQQLLASLSGLVLLRGKWVELDREQVTRSLEQLRRVEALSRQGGLTFAEAMRLLAGARLPGSPRLGEQAAGWARLLPGDWLRETLASLRSPAGLQQVDPGEELHTTLRPYQQVGLRWLYLLTRLGLGACLADDMGLGKTIQVLALLLVLRAAARPPQPNLLVAPASLLANWRAEAARFAPSLRLLLAHPSATPAAALERLGPEQVAGLDLVVTSYGTLRRATWLSQIPWQLVILDEAQAIKNPTAQQSRAVKQLQARARLALTGTPVENRLSDLWSIFDFIQPGLLGTGAEFTSFVKQLSTRDSNPYGPLRELVQPYILRRLKTDRNVIADLPDKTELKAFCSLSRKQAALYQQAVRELAETLADVSGIQRRGAVLAFLMRFKQICNHPSQWLADGAWQEADSGKWSRLRELCEVIAARQEKVLVFSQFREVIEPLQTHLQAIFGRPGLMLHGGTAVRQRQELVRQFQEDDATPFFVLSLKAGGTGLNLTAAGHVIHFDRWWNPAVENQATDRAFRIGQTRNVLVHKFICRGTVEERIDELISSKQQLAAELLEGDAEPKLTELPDDELLQLVALDLNSALAEG